MNKDFERLGFSPADIMVPQNCELSKWSVVACDQYTSQPEYWARVAQRVGDAPSALHLILPESCLEGPDVEQDISEINLTMARYLKEGRLRTYASAIHAVINAYSASEVLNQDYYFDETATREILLSLTAQAGGRDKACTKK